MEFKGKQVKIVDNLETFRYYKLIFKQLKFRNKMENPPLKNGTVGRVVDQCSHPNQKGVILLKFKSSTGEYCLIGSAGVKLIES